MEIQNGFLLSEVWDVQIIKTREDRRLQQGVVERLHTTIQKNLHAIAEDHALGNVDEESEHELEAGGAKRVGFVVGDTENGEDNRSRNKLCELLWREKRGKGKRG